MKFHAISGLPRTGSTLLCDILNQNPGFFASSTSFLPAMLNAVISLVSNTEEFKTYEINDKEESERKVTDSLMGLVNGWYGNVTDKVVFDKSRGWSYNLLTFNKLFPNGKMIVTVRDLRGVMASVEKEHQKFPLIDMVGSQIEKTIFTRASNLFSPEGLIGGCVLGVEDLIRRSNASVLFVRMEDLIENPKAVLETIYQHLGEEVFEHAFDKIKGTATDVDGLYHYKFPHTSSGKVYKHADDWRELVPKDISKEIMAKFPFYNETFNYG